MKKLLKYFLAFGLTVFLASGLLAQNGFVGSGYIMQAPRCTRATIASPYKGLIIYDTVALHYFGYTPNGWQILDSGAVDPSNLQYLTAGFGLKSNGNYNTLDPRTFGIDDSIVALKSDLDFVVGNDTPNYIIDTIINAPLASPVPGITYLVGTAPTGIFVGHANQPADFVTGTTYTYHTPILGDQGIVGRPFEYIYYDGTQWIIKPNKSVQTNYYDYGNKIFIGQAKAKPIDFGVKKKAIISFTSTGKLRFPYLTYVPAHPFLTVNPLDSNSVILDSFDVAIYFDSLRNNSGVLEGRKAGVWIPQFTLPTGGGGGTWGSITGTLSDQTDLQSALDAKVTANSSITGATKTKITYDSKGLVTAGANLSAGDIPDISGTYEVIANKATSFGTLNNTLYPTTQAVANYISGFGYLSSYTETDPVVKAITGIIKSNGTTISAAVAGTDYVTGASTNTFTNKSGNISQWTNDANYSVRYTRTAVKTANYTAAVNELVPVNTTSGGITITLPTAPADKARVAVKHIIQGSTNTVTIAAGGSDVFNKTAGSTTLTLFLLNQGLELQYDATNAIWTVLSDDLPLTQLDARYAAAGTGGITSLNTLTGSTQTFATGTSGTDFGISSSGTTHTFNIPDASGSNRGLVTTGTQTFAGQKIFSTAPRFTSLSTGVTNDSTLVVDGGIVKAYPFQYFDTSKAYVWTGFPHTWKIPNVAVSPTSNAGIYLNNPTAATSGVPNQNSPSIHANAAVWTGVSSNLDAFIYFDANSNVGDWNFKIAGATLTYNGNGDMGGLRRVNASSYFGSLEGNLSSALSGNNTTRSINADGVFNTSNTSIKAVILGSSNNNSVTHTNFVGTLVQNAYNQTSGSCIDYDFMIDRKETSLSSGVQRLFTAGTNSGTIGTVSTHTSLVAIDNKGKFYQSGTITAAGTTGAQTINKPSGTVNFAAAATSLVVTNSLVSTTSIIVCQILTHDGTATSTQVVAGSGSFTIYLNAAATAETAVYFEVKEIQ